MLEVSMALIIICKLIGSEMIPPLLPLIQDKLLHPKYISLSLSLSHLMAMYMYIYVYTHSLALGPKNQMFGLLVFFLPPN